MSVWSAGREHFKYLNEIQIGNNSNQYFDHLLVGGGERGNRPAGSAGTSLYGGSL